MTHVLHLTPSGSFSQFWSDPIHIASVFITFSLSTDTFSKSSSNPNKARAESKSDRTAVVSLNQDANIDLCYGLSIDVQISRNKSPKIYFKLSRAQSLEKNAQPALNNWAFACCLNRSNVTYKWHRNNYLYTCSTDFNDWVLYFSTRLLKQWKKHFRKQP